GTANVQRVVVDPHHSGSAYAFASNGVFKTSDGGRRWNLAAPNVTEFAQKLVFDSLDPRIVYASRSTGIFQSTGGGNSWAPTAFSGWGSNTSGLRGFAIDPRTPSTIYAAANGQLFKSTDSAKTWNSVGPLPEGGATLKELEVNPGDPAVLYAVTWRE